MNKPLGKVLIALLLMTVVALLAADRAAADAPKPALTIAFAGYDQLNADLKVLDKINPRLALADKLENLLQAATKGKKLAGLDKSRPWGVLVAIGESDEPTTQGYLPVTDLKELMAGIPAPGGDELKPNDKGVYEITGGGTTIYVKQKAKWAVLSNNEASLDNAVDDPAAQFSDLTKKYLVAVRGNVQNVPAARRDQFIGAMRGLVMFSLAAQGGNPEQQAMQQASVNQLFDNLTKLSKELETLVVGLGMDADTKSIYLDFETRAVEGSDLAKQSAAMKNAKTNFAGFAIPGAAMTMLASGETDADQVAQAKKTLDQLKTTIEKQLDQNDDLASKRKEVAKKLLEDAFDVAKQTLDLKKSDGGMAVVLGDNPAMVLGSLIAGGDKLDAAFKKLVKEVETDKPELSSLINLDAETYEGIKFHVAKIPVPPTGEAKNVFGDSVQIVLGLSETRMYLAAGKDPIAVLKKAIDVSKNNPDKPIQPMEMIISAEPIAKFFAKIIPDSNPSDAQAKKVADKLATQLAKTPGKDRITISVKPIANGSQLRISGDPGVIKAVMQMVALVAGMQSPDDMSEEN